MSAGVNITAMREQAHLSTACELLDALRGRELSASALVREALEACRHVGTQLNAISHVFEERALSDAKLADGHLSRGSGRKLEGLPILIKDMTPLAGVPTTRGSFVGDENPAVRDAKVVRRLRAEGAIVIGKATTAEYAYSSFTRSKRFGDTLNPWDLSRTSGGSSGGSAAAVASGVVALAEGSDMGGSVRIPAGACGVVGFKPSIGLLPMDIVPSSIDTISHFGPIARSVADAALFVDVTSGHFPGDMMSWPSRFDLDACAPRSLNGTRFAFSMDLGYCDVDPKVQAVVHSVLDKLREAGAVVDDVSLPWKREVYDQWAWRWYSLLGLFPEARSDENLEQMQPDLAAGIRAAKNLSASNLMELEMLRSRMNEDLVDVFATYDALLCPTNAVTAPLWDMSDGDFEGSLANGKLHAFDMCHPFNMVPTCPALSVPAGLATDGLPVGIQIVGPSHANEKVLSLGASLEALIGRLPKPTRKI